MGALVRKPLAWVVAAVLAIATGWALTWFQPWKLFTDRTVNEVLPVVATTPPVISLTSPPTSPASSPASGPAAQNVLVASGTLISHEHETSGTAKLVRLGDGQVQLVLENLSTSDGPDLRVWLTDQAVAPGSGGWRSSTTGGTWSWAGSRGTGATRCTRFRPAPTWPACVA